MFRTVVLNIALHLDIKQWGCSECDVDGAIFVMMLFFCEYCKGCLVNISPQHQTMSSLHESRHQAFVSNTGTQFHHTTINEPVIDWYNERSQVPVNMQTGAVGRA